MNMDLIRTDFTSPRRIVSWNLLALDKPAAESRISDEDIRWTIIYTLGGPHREVLLDPQRCRCNPNVCNVEQDALQEVCVAKTGMRVRSPHVSLRRVLRSCRGRLLLLDDALGTRPAALVRVRHGGDRRSRTRRTHGRYEKCGRSKP